MVIMNNNSTDIFNELINELVFLTELQTTADTRVINRLLVRSIFSLLDAFSSSLKLLSLNTYEYEKTIFSEKDLRFLREGEYKIENNVEVWKLYLPGIRESIKKSLKLYAKSGNTKSPLLKSAPLPTEFKEALKLRTHVTHPKCLDDLIITSSEMRSVFYVLEWLKKLFLWARDQEINNIKNIRTNIDTITKTSILKIKKSFDDSVMKK